MAGGNRKTTAAKPAAPKGQRYQNNDVKCSVDVGAKARQTGDDGAGAARGGPARDAKFQKGGTNKSAKSATDTPKDARTRACANWMADVITRGIRGIRVDFVKNVKPYIPAGSTDVSQDHAHLNRYEDILILDSTRVILKSSPDGEEYINANFVKISPDLVYICAQGPISNTIAHFWLMVIQEGVKVVLQLCQLVEEGKEKCDEYYPPAIEGNEWKTYGFVQVRVLDRNSNVAGMKKVTKSKMQVKMNDNVHELTHIAYLGWPDHSVAESVATCREVRNLIHRIYEKKPVVLHCSAGVGRTGTFAMIELVCHRLLIKHESHIEMSDLVKELRDQRMSAIQTDQQYVFVFRCVVEILLAEDVIPKSPDVTKFIESYEALIKRKKGDGKAKAR